MSAQSPTAKKTSPLLANLMQSYASGNSFSFGNKAQDSSKISEGTANQTTSVLPDISTNLDAVALDTADAVIENILARRQDTATQVASVASQIAPVQVDVTVPIATQPPVTQQPTLTAPQAFPLAVDQMYQEQQAQQVIAQQAYAQSGSASKKESLAASTPDTTIVDAGGGIQYVEQEKNPELPVEVEGFLQHVDDNATQAPQEIIMAQIAEPVALPTVIPKQAVVVLPITPDVEQTAKGKNAKFSVKWLVEWSHKMMKLFEGKVVYRPSEGEVK